MSGDHLARVTDEIVVAFEEQYLATLYPERRDFALSPPGNTHFEAYRAGLRSALARSAPLSDELQEGRRLLEAALASKSSRRRNSWDAWDWLANWFAYHGESLLHAASQAASTAARLAEAEGGWLQEHLFGRDAMHEIGYVGRGLNEWHVYVRRKYPGGKIDEWCGLPIVWHENVGPTTASGTGEQK